jgi:hypothetical protein
MHTYKKKPSYTYKVLDQEVEIVVLEENLNWVNFSSKL